MDHLKTDTELQRASQLGAKTSLHPSPNPISTRGGKGQCFFGSLCFPLARCWTMPLAEAHEIGF
jgi:hypothetical protein